jgi:hypothetical protein
MAWALAHQSRALTTAPWAFGDAGIYHPTPRSLFYGDAGFGAVPWFLPTFLATGNPTLASNLVFLGSVALTAWALHVVVARWTGSAWGGALAAWTFLTTRWVLWTWIPAVPNYAVLQYLPFVMLLAAAPGLGRGGTLVLFALVVLQGLTTLYVTVPMLLALGLVGAGRALVPATRRTGVALLGVVAAASVVLLLAHAGYWLVRLDNPDIARQSPWTVRERHDWTNLPWGPFRPGVPTGVPLAVLGVIGAGAVLALDRRRGGERIPPAWAHGGLWTAVGLALSITPTVVWFDRPVSVEPVALSSWLPVLRKPDRLGVAALLGLAVLAGAAFAEVAGRLQRRRALAAWAPPALFGAVALATYAQYAAGTATPAALGVAPLPAAYPLAAAVRSDGPLIEELRRPGGPLLELPATWSLAGRRQPLPITNARAMYRQIFHGRRLVNGYDGFWPAGFPERMAAADRLPDPDALARLRRETGVALVLVHAGEWGAFERSVCADYARLGRMPADCRTDLGAAPRRTWLALADTGGGAGLRLVARDGETLLFAVEGPDARDAPPSRADGG